MVVEILFVGGVLLFLYWLISVLDEQNRPAVPKTYYKADSDFARDVIARIKILQLPYVPPLLWGRFGQWQTLAYGIFGHRRSGRWRPRGSRVSVLCRDGATVTYELYEPLRKHESDEDVTFMLCPGIANSSESVYIRSFVLYAQTCGFRCAVLNHLGVVASVKLTAARLFTYGGTVEYGAMVDDVRSRYSTKAVALGFSMGANVVSCYLAEAEENQTKVVCGISVCQGYDIIRSRPMLLEWKRLRRGYMYSMTRNMKRIFERNRGILFSDDVMKSHPSIDIDKVFRATCLEEIDQHYTRVVLGYEDLDEMYHDLSSSNKLHKINIPMLFVNAADDPIVPVELLDCVKDHASRHEDAMLVVTRHGGHLGFLEGNSFLMPEMVSWLCRLAVQYSNAIVDRSCSREVVKNGTI